MTWDVKSVVKPKTTTTDFYDTQGYKSWSHSMKNVSIPEVNMLNNSSTLAVSVPINLSIKFGFCLCKRPQGNLLCVKTERGGSVVTHETRIREVPGSNPVAGQPG